MKASIRVPNNIATIPLARALLLERLHLKCKTKLISQESIGNDTEYEFFLLTNEKTHTPQTPPSLPRSADATSV